MGHLGKKMRNAQKYHSGEQTAWSQKNVRGGNERCAGCRVKYRDMSAATFARHKKLRDRGDDDCPDI